jgi:hypothetical protein
MENMSKFEIELYEETQQVCARVHELLDGPKSDGQMTGNYETQRVMLTLPRGIHHLAAFMSIVENDKPSELDFWKYVTKTPDDSSAQKHLNRKMRDFLARSLVNHMHLHLHMLATQGPPTMPDAEAE